MGRVGVSAPLENRKLLFGEAIGNFPKGLGLSRRLYHLNLAGIKLPGGAVGKAGKILSHTKLLNAVAHKGEGEGA